MDILQLTAIAKAPTTDRARNFIQNVYQESELLRALNNFDLGATDGMYRPAAGGQTVAARAINAAFTSQDMTRPALVSAALSIHGFDLKHDTSFERDYNLGVGVAIDTWLDSELQTRAIETADAIDAYIVAGSGSSNVMKGLKTLLDGSTDLPGLGITGVINAKFTGDSFDLTTSANYDKFMESFEKWKAEIKGADGVIVNRSLAARLTTIAKIKHSYSQMINEFGKQVEFIDGVRIIRVDDTVITNTEPNDNGTPVNDTTSMYIFRNAVGHWTVKSNSGLATWEKGEIEDEPASLFRFEMTGFNEVRHKYAIRRVRNIKV